MASARRVMLPHILKSTEIAAFILKLLDNKHSYSQEDGIALIQAYYEDDDLYFRFCAALCAKYTANPSYYDDKPSVTILNKAQSWDKGKYEFFLTFLLMKPSLARTLDQNSYTLLELLVMPKAQLRQLEGFEDELSVIFFDIMRSQEALPSSFIVI